MWSVCKTGTCSSHGDCKSWGVTGMEFKTSYFHSFSEFLKDIIMNQFINISSLSKDGTGNTLIG